MQKHKNNYMDTKGNAYVGASVTVNLKGTSTKATLYEDDETTQKDNPLTTDANGMYSFKAADGKYDLDFVKSGVTTVERLELNLLDTDGVKSSFASIGTYTYAQDSTPSATAADESWLKTDTGGVYYSTAAGTGNWVFNYAVVILTSEGYLLTEGDSKHGNNYLLQSQTIQDIQPFQALLFNGESGNVLVPDHASYAELFANGGTYVCIYNALTGGESDDGTFFSKGHTLRFDTASNLLVLGIIFSGTAGVWTSSTGLTINKNSVIGVAYDGSDVANNPTVYVDGVPVTMTETTTPVGTLTSDVTSDLYFGNNGAGNRTFYGLLKEERFYNRELTVNELKAITSNPNMAIDPADESGSNVDLTSGTVTVGKKYRTVTFVVGDDFSNIADTGAAANVTGAEWTATGTTPTTWTNSSVLNQLGCTARYKPQDIIPGWWKDSSGNGNHGAITGGTIVNKSEQLVEVIEDIEVTLEAGTGTITLGTNQKTLSVRKYGRAVYVQGRLGVSSISAPSGALTIEGLTYAASDQTGEAEDSVFNISTTLLASNPTGSIRARIVAGSNVIEIQDGADTTGSPADFAGRIGGTTGLTISGWYLTDD